MEFINKYINELENLNENYCHDEETVMNLVYNKNKDDFYVLKVFTNFTYCRNNPCFII